MPIDLDKYQKRVLILGYIMGRLGKVIVIVFLISSLGMINLPSVNADGVVDQSNTPPPVAILVPVPTTVPVISQFFTPSVPDIVAVDIFLQGGNAGVRLDILIVDNADVTVFLETDFNPGCPCSGLTPVHVDFTGAQGTPLDVGLLNRLGIVHSSTSNDFSTTWAGSTGTAYAPGSASYPTAAAGQDFFFVTYEGISVAVGSINIPIDTTSMLVAGSEMNSVWITIAIAAAIGVGILIIRRNYFSAE